MTEIQGSRNVIEIFQDKTEVTTLLSL